jgi:tRNA A22 N-methylase
MDTFTQVKKSIVGAAKDAGETIVDAAKSARDAMIDAKDAVVGGVIDAKDAVVDAAVDAKDAVVDAAVDAKDKTVDVAHDAKDLMVKLADKVTGVVSDSPGDILNLLKMDHELVSGFFEQLEATSNTSRELREGLFGQLKYELEAHSVAEEKHFYSVLRKAHEPSDVLSEAHSDHDLVAQLLIDLAAQPMTSERWMAQLRVLKENVERHVQMEEDELFAAAKDRLSGTERDDIGRRFKSEKRRLDPKEEGRTDRGARGSQAQRRTPLKTAVKRGLKNGLKKVTRSSNLHA